MQKMTAGVGVVFGSPSMLFHAQISILSISFFIVLLRGQVSELYRSVGKVTTSCNVIKALVPNYGKKKIIQ